eukprot:g9.t1
MPSSSNTTPQGACAGGQVGLISTETGKWTDCIDVPWGNDAETASFLADGTVVVYVTPGDGDDTFFAHIDFHSGNITKVIVGGDQGNLLCSPDGFCYGIVPGDNTNPTMLMRVNSRTGVAKSALALPDYIGYSVDGAVLNPDTCMYHAILVGKVHGGENLTSKSNQWLCTMNVAEAGAVTMLAEIPVAMHFMGPMATTTGMELMTFGSDLSDGLVRIDWKTGKQKMILDGFGTVYTFSAGYDRTTVFAINIYPAPARLFAVTVMDEREVAVRTNVTFGETVHALAASWA